MFPQPRSLRASIIFAVVMMFLIGGGCSLVVRSYVKEATGAPGIVSTVAPGMPDLVRVVGYLVSVDPMAGKMEMELDFSPQGRFSAGGLLTVPLEVEVSTLGGEPLHFPAGRRMFPRAVEIGFLDGAVADYPVDTHHVQIQIRVLEPAADEGGPQVAVPVELELDSHFHGYAIGARSLPGMTHGYLGIEMELKRSALVIGTVGFCMMIMWALAVMNLLMLWAVLTRRMEVDIELFAYMSGLIVALYFFREVLPDAPPFLGVLVDYTAFFWAELITAICAVIFAVIWYRQLLKRPPGDTTPPWFVKG